MLEHLNPTPQKPSRVVVLGAYGFVGGTCARLLAARGVPVLPLDKDDIDLMASGAAEELKTRLAPDDAILVVSRSAFRLKGSLGPPQRADNLLARSAGMPKLHPVEGGLGQEGARSCTPDRLGYVLIPACDRLGEIPHTQKQISAAERMRRFSTSDFRCEHTPDTGIITTRSQRGCFPMRGVCGKQGRDHLWAQGPGIGQRCAGGFKSSRSVF